jgi:PhoPQ-activated pathogenicity-related protein
MGRKLFDIVDPLKYKHLITMPKYLITATGDEFFVPDSTEHFWNQLEGEKTMRNIPNVKKNF